MVYRVRVYVTQLRRRRAERGHTRAEGAVEDLGNLSGFARAGWRGEHQAIARCQMGQDFLLVR